MKQEVGFHLTGSIKFSGNPVKVEEMKHQTSRHRWNQARQMVITPDEIHELHPLLNMDGVNNKGYLSFELCYHLFTELAYLRQWPNHVYYVETILAEFVCRSHKKCIL